MTRIPDGFGACRVERLGPDERATAKALFAMMAKVFDEEHDDLSDAYVGEILARGSLWTLAAFSGDEIVGGLTAHVLPLTRLEVSELFIYDLAVRVDHQRRGIGRLLIEDLRRRGKEAGMGDVFVPADNEDPHALDFYRAVGGIPSPVTFFTFAGSRR